MNNFFGLKLFVIFLMFFLGAACSIGRLIPPTWADTLPSNQVWPKEWRGVNSNQVVTGDFNGDDIPDIALIVRGRPFKKFTNSDKQLKSSKLTMRLYVFLSETQGGRLNFRPNLLMTSIIDTNDIPSKMTRNNEIWLQEYKIHNSISEGVPVYCNEIYFTDCNKATAKFRSEKIGGDTIITEYYSTIKILNPKRDGLFVTVDGYTDTSCFFYYQDGKFYKFVVVNDT